MLEKLNYNGFEIRTKIINDKYYWCASDIGNVLRFKDIQRQVNKLETKGGTISPTQTDGGIQNMLYIDEPSLYELIFKSRLSEAIKFRKWVFEDVLPKIRKTGSYSIPSQIKKMSTQKRNALTDAWKDNGVNKPHEFINLTLQEYKSLGFGKGKRKKDLTKEEMLMLSALESMEMLKLFNSDVDGYYECRDSIKDTSKTVIEIVQKKEIL